VGKTADPVAKFVNEQAARIAKLEAECAALQTTVSVMERALWVALDGKEVVVRDGTPADILWVELPDGGQLVRREMISQPEI